uniref:Band 7 domain-containing protein n=1 Tax=Caenorhabditis japonica TaxID=281687 RepID=A0A8R1ENZ5_CAEJA
MTFFSSYKYSALAQNDPEEATEEVEMESLEGFSGVDFGDPSKSVMEYGMPEGSFDSVFTYAPYNDLDKMGYEVPKRHGMVMGNRYGNFTYTRDYGVDSEEKIQPLNTVELLIYCLSMVFVLITMPLSLLFALKFISTSEKLVVLRLGRAQKTRGPGVALVVPCIDTTHKVTTSITAFNVPPLQVNIVASESMRALSLWLGLTAICSESSAATSFSVLDGSRARERGQKAFLLYNWLWDVSKL